MKLDRFARFAWLVLAYNLLVILWGAYVRASGSGAGCGSHWPLCNGEVLPRAPQTQTLVEFAHRATSGVALLLVVALVVWAFRAYPKGHRVRAGSLLSLVFILVEALIGAGLVLFELVAHDASAARAFSMSAHLVNTFLLLASLVLTAWWATGGAPAVLRGQGNVLRLLGAAWVGALLIAVTGGVSALGDTLFPAGSLGEGLRQDLSPASHFLLRLRVLHPMFAVLFGCYAVFVASYVNNFLRPSAWTKKFGGALTAVFLLQIGAGILNVYLLAPVWLQLLHLLLADLFWLALVLTSASALAQTPARDELAREAKLRPAEA